MIIIKTDLITIFNQLTSSELADYNLFEDILSNHYEKFKYLYSLIKKVNLNKIDKIYCKTSSSSIHVFIEPHDIKYLNDIIYAINTNRNSYMFSDYFTLNVYEANGTLHIEISLTDDEVKEGDIYANRFI